MDNQKNYTVITAPIMVIGIPEIGWMISVVGAAFIGNIINLITIPLFALIGAGIIFFAIFIFIFKETKKDPDFIFISIIRLFNIKSTLNKDFSGNCYVA